MYRPSSAWQLYGWCDIGTLTQDSAGSIHMLLKTSTQEPNPIKPAYRWRAGSFLNHSTGRKRTLHMAPLIKWASACMSWSRHVKTPHVISTPVVHKRQIPKASGNAQNIPLVTGYEFKSPGRMENTPMTIASVPTKPTPQTPPESARFVFGPIYITIGNRKGKTPKRNANRRNCHQLPVFVCVVLTVDATDAIDAREEEEADGRSRGASYKNGIDK